ncbi:MAG: 50S ribosomal protein L11 methyltransferase [Oscillospiraceae bacterium]|nr:50S ribosomal protein L11 methyltransferase [Oscillospiraceae bacterium]
MDYQKIDIYTESEAIYPLTSLLSELGITGFEIHDAADFEDFLENKDMNWDYVDDTLMNLKNVKTHVTLYLQQNEQGLEMFTAMQGVLAEIKSKDAENFYGTLKIETDKVNEEDWANNWKQYYKPFNVGKKLIIKPTWEQVNDTNSRKILEIDPASSFGTGQHHTTRLVMELLEQNISGGERVLDLGCGSGILSIAALLLGAKSVTMTDVFQNAVTTASENVEQNGFDKSHYIALCGNIADDPALRRQIGTDFDIITANIVADVIISMSPFFRSFLKENGILIVSGIITERLDEVKAALQENGITIESITEKEDWNAILCKV